MANIVLFFRIAFLIIFSSPRVDFLCVCSIFLISFFVRAMLVLLVVVRFWRKGIVITGKYGGEFVIMEILMFENGVVVFEMFIIYMIVRLLFDTFVGRM